jgi:hypothetical protein
LGILLKDMYYFLAASFPTLSANSFPQIPACAFIQENVIVQFRLSRAIAVFLISSI